MKLYSIYMATLKAISCELLGMVTAQVKSSPAQALVVLVMEKKGAAGHKFDNPRLQM